jgi:small GTP-binding protein
MSAVKICVVGDSGVGKSSIISRFSHDEFNVDQKSTTGIDSCSKELLLERDDSTVVRTRVNVVAKGGHDRWRAVTLMLYNNSRGALVVFDVCNRKSFENAVFWIGEMRNHAGAGVVISLIANKCDLLDERLISTTEAAQFALQHGLLYAETSALDNTGIQGAFRSICESVLPEFDCRQNVAVAVPLLQHHVQEQDRHASRHHCRYCSCSCALL